MQPHRKKRHTLLTKPCSWTPESSRFNKTLKIFRLIYYTELGIMIETPSSVFVAEELAKLVDFFSVGTNDLTQYTLACDRQANDLGKFYDPHHPALLRAIKMAADAAHKAGIWIGICGELGADISMLPTFLAMGIDELSVSPSAVLPVRAAIRQSIAQTCTLEMLEC